MASGNEVGMNRKGIVEGTLVKVILFLVTAFLVGAVVYIVLTTIAAETPSQTCAASLTVQMATYKLGINSPFDLHCPRKFITISDKEVDANYIWRFLDDETNIKYVWWETDELNGERNPIARNAVSDDSGEFQQDFREIVSNEMYECWQAFQYGDRHILNQESTFRRYRVCVVCADLYIDRTQQESFPLNIDEYMSSYQHFDVLQRDRGVSYEDVIYTDETPSHAKTCEERFIPNDVVIENNDAYSVVFMMRSSRFSSYRYPFSFVMSGLVELVTPIETGDDLGNVCQTVSVVPSRDLAQYCDVVVN